MSPITYSEATVLFFENGSLAFSFVVSPYGVQKTMMVQGSRVVAAHPNTYTVAI